MEPIQLTAVLKKVVRAKQDDYQIILECGADSIEGVKAMMAMPDQLLHVVIITKQALEHQGSDYEVSP